MEEVAEVSLEAEIIEEKVEKAEAAVQEAYKRHWKQPQARKN